MHDVSTEKEFCTVCKKNVEVKYEHEEIGDAESGPCMAMIGCEVECGHDVWLLESICELCDGDGCYECAFDIHTYK